MDQLGGGSPGGKLSWINRLFIETLKLLQCVISWENEGGDSAGNWPPPAFLSDYWMNVLWAETLHKSSERFWTRLWSKTSCRYCFLLLKRCLRTSWVLQENTLKREEGSNYLDIYSLNISCSLFALLVIKLYGRCISHSPKNNKPAKAEATLNPHHLYLASLLKSITQGPTYN